MMEMTCGHKGLLHYIGFRIKDCGVVCIVLICTKKFEISPSNEMTCDGRCTFHCMDAIVTIACQVLSGMYCVTCKCGNYMGMGGLEAKPVLVTSCCGANTSIPNAFTILGLFNIVLMGS